MEPRPRVRFYVDEHVPYAVVYGLRLRGIDVLTLKEAGTLGLPDPDHLARARALGRVVYTNDADFLRLNARGVPHAGIAYAPQGTPVARAVAGLVRLHAERTPEAMRGRVEFL